MMRCISWKTLLTVVTLVPSVAASFELESARRMPVDTPEAIDELTRYLQPLGSKLDVVSADRKAWPIGVRAAAAIARCASQYPMPPHTHTGPRGQGAGANAFRLPCTDSGPDYRAREFSQ